jgi:dihydrodipicolinate reductase
MALSISIVGAKGRMGQAIAAAAEAAGHRVAARVDTGDALVDAFTPAPCSNWPWPTSGRW